MVLDTGDLSPHSNVRKMAWAAKRRTPRAEDRVYCLMGVFDVNMPLLYGEGGQKAFLGLQEGTLKHDYDHSVFAWSTGKRQASGLPATDPECFGNSQEVVTTIVDDPREPFSMTNRGLSIKLEITPWSTDTYLAYLDCAPKRKCDKERCPSPTRMGIFLRRLQKDDQYVRISVRGRSLWYDNHKVSDQLRLMKNKRLLVRQRPSPYDVRNCLKSRVNGFDFEVGCSSAAVRIVAAHMSNDNRTAYLKFGEWACVVNIDVLKEHK